MRTGAIFARGSCRALKWMALVGMVFSLGSGQVVAQTIEGAYYNVGASPADGVVTVKMSAAVQASSGTGTLFGDFKLGTTAGTATSLVAGTAVDEFTVTFGDTPITGTPTLTYTPSTDSDDPVIDSSSGRNVGALSATVMSAVPDFGLIPHQSGYVGLAFSFEVPEVTGGVGDITYTIPEFDTAGATPPVHVDGELPEGLEFDDDTRMITGKPAAAGRFLVTVTAEDDAGADDEIPITSGAANHTGTQDFYIDVSAPPALTVTVGANPMTIAEGEMSTITATASRMVAADDVPVKVSLAVVGEAMLSAYEITIAEGMDSGQVTLTAEEDDDYEPATVTVTATGSGIINQQTIEIMVTDDAPPEPLSVVVDADPKTIAEGGTSTITAMANRMVMATDGTVTVQLRVAVGNATLSATSITIAEGMDSGEVTLTAAVDEDYEGETVVVVATGSGVAANHPNVEIIVTDMAPPAALKVTMSAAPMTIKEGGMSTITATANRTVMPNEAVTVTLSVVPPAGATLSAPSITIAPGTDSGSVTLTAAVDDDYEDETVTVAASATGLTGPPQPQTLDITVTDNDQPPAKRRGQITAMTFSGGDPGERVIGGVKRYHVEEGQTNVMLNVTVQWDHAELAELAALGRRAVSVDLMIKGAQNDQNHVLPRWLSWIDDEGDVDFPNTPGELGRLSGRVMVSVPPVPSDFPNSTRHHKSATGSIALLILHDEHEAEEDAFYIDAVASADVDLDATDARNRTTPLAVIEDDDQQRVTISGAKVMHEGDGSETFTVTAVPKRLDLPLEVRLDVVDLDGATISGTRYSLSDASLVFNEGGNGVNSDTVELRFPSPDGDRVDDNYKLRATVVDYSLTSGGFDTTVVEPAHDIKIVDIHNLPPVTVDPYSSMRMEGDTVELTLVVHRNPRETPRVDPETNIYTNEALTIMVGTDGAATKGEDYTVPTSVSVDKYEHTTGANWTQRVKVAVELAIDEDVEPDETLDLTFTVNGTKADNGPLSGPSEHEHPLGKASLTITDETEKLVWAKTADQVEAAVNAALTTAGGGDGLNPNEVIEILGAELFDAAAGIVVEYAASSSDPAVAMGSAGDRRLVTVTPMSEGMAMVTVTATATSPSGATIVEQTKPNVAQIMFSVDVMLDDLTFMVMGPDDMNLHESGPGGMVKVTTNRPVTENTEVMLMRDGSSSAGDDDYMLDPPLVTIMAGQMEGHTMVMATEDNMAEEMEMLTLFLVVDGMQMTDKSVSFYIWDAAVPALPIIAQLLLAAFLALGGYRRYLRR